MRRSLLPLVLALLLGGLLGPGRLLRPTLAQEATPAMGGSGLVGAWQVVVTSAGEPTTPALVTFAADGVMLAADVPVQPLGPGQVAFISPGQGVWIAGPPAAFTFVELLATADGSVVGSNVIRGEVTLSADGQTIRGPFQFDALDPSGKTLGGGQGTFTGTRMTVQPLGTPLTQPVMATPEAASMGGTPSAAGATQPITVPVSLVEMTITPAQTTFKVGQPYTFVVTNNGTIEHEMVIERRGAVDQALEANGQEAEAADLDPGQTKTLTWTFTEPGDYQLACHIPGHYEAGMVTAITVTP
jgi:uncharacterized cupredoxin-like copper-binding protein